nr:SMP-30/gluconolactonase/LRE family protein [uncultured Neokomagataea sp.]
MTTLKHHDPICVYDIRATLAEGPVWSAAENALYFVDIVEEKVHRFVPATGERTVWTAPDRIGFLLPVEGGTFLAGLRDGLHRFDPKTGGFSVDTVVEPEHPGNRLNDGCVDAKGRIWFGTMDNGETHPTGSIYRVLRGEKGLEVTHHDEGYTVSNGPTVSPCGKVLYVCDSPEQRIYAFDVDEAGELSNERVFATLTEGYPDGIVTDSEGTVWSGVWGGSKILRFLPDGTQLEPIAMPVSNVTKITFGGDDLRTVYVTTARKGLSEEALAREEQAGSIYAFRTDVPGLAQRQFAL